MTRIFFFRIADLVCESPKKLAETIVNLQFIVEEKERAIEVVRQALEHQRKLSANFSQKFQKELNVRLAQQKSEYEAAIHRHQNFIDKLIEDKKSLSERCDTLTLDLGNSERKFQETLKAQEQRHSQEIRRLKVDCLQSFTELTIPHKKLHIVESSRNVK